MLASGASADAQMSHEKLEESHVTLGAVARLSFNLRASTEPRKGQVSVEGPSGPLLLEEFRFLFNCSSEAAQLHFVVKKAGRYRVIIRLPQVQANGDWHDIRTESKTENSVPYEKQDDYILSACLIRRWLVSGQWF